MERGFSLVLILVVLGILSAIGFGSFYLFNKQQTTAINSFDDCAKKYPVLESFPEQCNTPDGKHFVRELSQEEKLKLAPSTGPSSSLNTNSNLKIFRDEKEGIEFSYPISWMYEDKDNGLNRYIVFGAPTEINHIGEKVAPYPANYVVLKFNPIGANQTVEQAIGLSKDMITKLEDIRIAGLEAKKITHMGCLSGECTDIIFPTKMMLYTFSIENSNNPDFQAYLKDVTETFKFTNN